MLVGMGRRRYGFPINRKDMIKKGKRPSDIQLQMDLSVDGVRNIIVFAPTAEDRALALTRIQKALPQIESLEAALQEA